MLILDHCFPRGKIMAMMVMMVMTTTMVVAGDKGRHRLHKRQEINMCLSCETTACDEEKRCLILCHKTCPNGYYDATNNTVYNECPGGKSTTIPTTTTTNIATTIPTTIPITTTPLTTTTPVPPQILRTISNIIPEPQSMQRRKKRELNQTYKTKADTATSDTNRTSPHYRHLCVKCQVDNCSECPQSPATRCQRCHKGFQLFTNGTCKKAAPRPGDKDAGSRSSGAGTVIGAAVGGCVAFLLVVVLVVVFCLKRTRRKSVDVSGGCSIDLITTERIPSSVRNSQSQLYGNNITVSEDTEYLKAIVPDLSRKPSGAQEKQKAPLTKMSSVEMKEIDDLPAAPTLPGQDDEAMYDDMGHRSPETPKVYLGLVFQNDTQEANNVYENTNVVLYENLQPPTKKKQNNSRSRDQKRKEAKLNSEQEREQLANRREQEEQEEMETQNDMYVNTAQITNIIHNKNCDIKLQRPLDGHQMSSPTSPGSLGAADNTVEDELTSEEGIHPDYVLVPPSYDSSVNGNDSSSRSSSNSKPKRGPKKSQQGKNDKPSKPQNKEIAGDVGKRENDDPNATSSEATSTQSSLAPHPNQDPNHVYGNDEDEQDTYEEADGGDAIYANGEECCTIYSMPRTQSKIYSQPD